MCQNKVAYRVGTLNREFVSIKCLEEPWVLGSNELSRLLVGPQLVFVVLVLLNATALRFDPALRYRLVYVGLVNDFGDQLRAFADGTRVRGWEFGARDAVFGAIDDEEGQQGPYAANQEANYENVEDEENEHALAHRGGWRY